jgi:2'-5' RNA ligase
MSEPIPEHLRLFVACEIPEDARRVIASAIETLRQRSGEAVRWVRPDGLHVTLKFLGEVPLRNMPRVKLACQEAVAGHSPFTLEFASIGTFGGREGLRLMWAGIAGDVLRLEALVRSMNTALAVVGFEPERRPFRPHLTLGRVRDEIPTRKRAEIEVAVGKLDIPETPWRVSHVSLMRSHLLAGGARYETLATFPLRSHQV